MLRPAEIEAIRRAFVRLMPDTASVLRFNQQSFQWVTIGSEPCRVIPKRAITSDGGGGLEGITLWNILLPYDSDVEPGDRLTVGSEVYSVTDADRHRTEPFTLIAQCTRL